MNPKKHFLRLLLALPLGVGCVAEEAPMPSFKSADELVSGWYHRHEYQRWMKNGLSKDTIDGILARIASATGERADPNWIDSIATYGPGNWVYEWVEEGRQALSRANKNRTKGNHTAAFANYKQALTLFSTASWPHLGLEDDRAALSLARTAYLDAGQYLARPIQHLEFSVGQQKTKGYLHVPEGPGPFPILVFTHGSDVTKEDGFAFFENELQRRGIAFFSVDLPGIGEASHISLLAGSDAVLAGAVKFVSGLEQVDASNIFVAGASFGGNAAARAFFNLDVAGVVSMCGPLHSPFLAPPEVFEALPALTIDGVKARLGILGKTSETLAEIAPGLSLANQGFYQSTDKISTPLLIFTTNQDPVAPLGDLDVLKARANHLETLVIDMEGHCPPRWLRQPIVARWLEEQMREEQR